MASSGLLSPLVTSVVQRLGYFSAKKEQLEIIEGFLSVRDCSTHDVIARILT